MTRSGNTGLLGHRLKEAREKQNLTQEELADRVGVAYQQIWRWETGKNDPTGDMLVRMARILNVTADYLLGLVDTPSGLLTEDDLSPVERRLIQELRSGHLRDALQTITSLSNPDQPPAEVPKS